MNDDKTTIINDETTETDDKLAETTDESIEPIDDKTDATQGKEDKTNIEILYEVWENQKEDKIKETIFVFLYWGRIKGRLAEEPKDKIVRILTSGSKEIGIFQRRFFVCAQQIVINNKLGFESSKKAKD